MDPELQEVKLLRKQLGMTQAQLAKASGVSQSLIAKVESGLVDPSFSAGRRILDAARTFQQKQEPTAAELMQQALISCRSSDRITTIIKKMQQHAISQLPVMEGGHAIGLINERIILQHMDEVESKTTVGDLMDDAPPIIPGATPKRVVAELLSHYSIILVRHGRIRGIITKADLLRTV